MTIKAIRAMFEAGQVWEARNTLHETANGPRTLIKLNTVEFIWQGAQANKPWHTRFPKASEIIEAGERHLMMYLDHTHTHTLTLTRRPDNV